MAKTYVSMDFLAAHEIKLKQYWLKPLSFFLRYTPPRVGQSKVVQAFSEAINDPKSICLLCHHQFVALVPPFSIWLQHLQVYNGEGERTQAFHKITFCLFIQERKLSPGKFIYITQAKSLSPYSCKGVGKGNNFVHHPEQSEILTGRKKGEWILTGNQQYLPFLLFSNHFNR